MGNYACFNLRLIKNKNPPGLSNKVREGAYERNGLAGFIALVHDDVVAAAIFPNANQRAFGVGVLS
jgi:hypothetical protein